MHEMPGVPSRPPSPPLLRILPFPAARSGPGAEGPPRVLYKINRPFKNRTPKTIFRPPEASPRRPKTDHLTPSPTRGIGPDRSRGARPIPRSTWIRRSLTPHPITYPRHWTGPLETGKAGSFFFCRHLYRCRALDSMFEVSLIDYKAVSYISSEQPL